MAGIDSEVRLILFLEEKWAYTCSYMCVVVSLCGVYERPVCLALPVLELLPLSEGPSCRGLEFQRSLSCRVLEF